MTRTEILTHIAKNRIGAEILETRNSDSLDFYDVSVWALKRCLNKPTRQEDKQNETKG